MPLFKVGSTGSEVAKIQAVLKKYGYTSESPDGIFGSNTKEAVIKFQKNNGLVPDGIIGDKTYNSLMRLILGYDIYTIKPNDTLYTIAKKYNTTVSAIVTANPGINPYFLIPGERIIVPFSKNVVDTNIPYTYATLKLDLEGLSVRYPFITVGVSGKSVLGRNLYYVKLGSGKNTVFYNAAHHALEWITSPLLMEFIENFSNAYANNKSIKGYVAGDIWKESTIYLVPMVNPDGVDLVINGLKKTNPYYNDLIKWNKGSTDFSKTWEANNRGVDLNHNYDASWELSKQLEEQMGITGPGPTRYGGTAPESEPEAQAMVNFTKIHDFRLVIAYHSQGEVIYYKYGSVTPPESLKIAQLFSNVSGYKLDETTGISSYGGYKDWFIEDFGRPGFTIEVGKGKNPLPISQFPQIYSDNEELLLLASVI